MRLRYVTVADFRKSEIHNYDEFRAQKKALAESFRSDDVVLFLNAGCDQLVFVYGFKDCAENGAGERKILASRRLRLTNGRWTPQLLVNYGELVGLKLEGLKTFQERYQEHKEELAVARREHYQAKKEE